MTVVGARPLSQNSRLKWVTWTSGEVVAVGDRMPRREDLALGRVVLDVHRGHVASGPTAEPALGEPGLVRALQDDDVHVLLPQLRAA